MADQKAKDMGIGCISPGPWRWKDPNPDPDYLPVLIDANGLEVCSFGSTHNYDQAGGNPPADADAALIADAPVMLDLLAKWASAYESSLPRGPHAQHCDCRYHLTLALLDKHGRTSWD